MASARARFFEPCCRVKLLALPLFGRSSNGAFYLSKGRTVSSPTLISRGDCSPGGIKPTDCRSRANHCYAGAGKESMTSQQIAKIETAIAVARLAFQRDHGDVDEIRVPQSLAHLGVVGTVYYSLSWYDYLSSEDRDLYDQYGKHLSDQAAADFYWQQHAEMCAAEA